MFVLEGKIEIGNFVFRVLHDVEITKSVELIADTAIIKLPTRFKVKQNNEIKFTEVAIKVGNPVKITLAYENKYKGVEFIGFVKKIKPTTPIEVHCEDAMWLLRRKNITKVWEKTTLKEILQEVVKGTDLRIAENIPKIPLENYTIRNANGVQVLQHLKKEFRLSSFINDNNELYCGLKQLTNINEQVIYDLNYNLIENNLEYKTKEERKIKVRYTYIAPDNKRKHVEQGDNDGALRSFHTSVVSDENLLREMAKSEVEKLKYDGFDGEVVSFLIPYATRGMVAKIEDKEYPHKKGTYFIKKVVTTFGTDGAKRTVTIGNKL